MQSTDYQWFIMLGLYRRLRAAIHGFVRDDCFLRASALTFYTLLSIVPMLAVAFGIAKGFGFEETLEQQIRSNFKEYDLLVAQVIEFAHSYLKHTQGGLIAGAGVIVLLWTVLRLLSNIEDAFNKIWKIGQSRTLSRKFSDYLATIVICPIFFVASSSLTVYLTSQVTLATEKITIMDTMSPVLFFLLKLLPFFLSWMLFTFFYIFMPNTHVRFRSAFFAGVVAGTAYQILQWAYIHFQFKLSNYGAIYGSFAALPLFLVWLNVSWNIVLAGAEVAFYSEHGRAESIRNFPEKINIKTKKQLAYAIAALVGKAFTKGEPPLTLEQIVKQVNVPYDVVRSILDDLISCKLIIEVNNGGLAYQPAVNPQLLTYDRVAEAWDECGEDLPVVPV